MTPQVRAIRDWFNQIYLGGIPLMIRDETAFLSFVCGLTAVEALAGYRYPKVKAAGARFRRFIKTYFPEAYHPLADDLWNFRNGMIHGFCPRRFVLTHHHSHVHLEKSKQGATILNAEDMYAVLLTASKRFFTELETSAELEDGFVGRLNSKEGGNVVVGIVEVS